MEKNPYIYRISSVTNVVDGDTIDVIIDLGFDILIKKRIRLSGVDTPESRTTNITEKRLGLQVKEWLKKQLEGQKDILICTELPDSTEKYGRVLGRLYVNNICLNDRMIEEGYAWKYDGGTKKKDFSLLKPL